MAQLYNRRGVSASSPAPIYQPKVNDIGVKAFDFIAKTTKRLSDENYALGRIQLIDEVLTTSYNEAKDNPKQFNELIKSGFERGTEGLPNDIKDKIIGSAKDKITNLQIKVGKNLNKRLDFENTQRVTSLMESTLNSDYGINSTNRAIADALTTGSDREEVDSLIAINAENYRRLSSLAGAKNLNGSHIIGSKSLRSSIENGNMGMSDAIRGSYEQLSVEALKNFDETVFMDKNRFMEKTGINDKEYESLSSDIKRRRKALDSADKRQLHSQAEYNSSVMMWNHNPETMKQIKESGVYTDEQYSSLEAIVEESQKIKTNPALMTKKDDQYLNQFSKLMSVIGSKNDGSVEYKANLFNDMLTAKKAVVDLRKQNGIDEETDTIIDRTLGETLADQVFADTLNLSFEEGTALRSMILSASDREDLAVRRTDRKTEREEAEARGDLTYQQDVKINKMGTMVNTGKKETVIVKKGDIISSDIEDSMKREAVNGLKFAQQFAISARSPLIDEQQRAELYNKAKSTIDQTNQNIIKIKYSRFINTPTMVRLEKERAEGKTPVFTVGADTYEFHGFTSNNILIKAKY